MSWRDNLKPASFRGVPFEINQHSLAGGRRVVSHEYPQRDTPYVEDMGLKQRSFNLSAFVIGDDYMAIRDRLISALEKKGAGTLVHPYLGTMNVVAESYSMEEILTDGGMATFSIDFVQSEAVKYPENTSNAASVINTAGQEAIAKAAVITDTAVVIDGYPSTVPEQLEGLITLIAGKMIEEGLNIARSKSTTVVSISGRLSEIDDYLKESYRIVSSASVYARKPANMVYQFANVIGRIPGIVDEPINAVRAYGRIFRYVFDYFGLQSWIATPSGMAAMGNATALRDSTLVSIASSAALSATEIEYETNAQAYDIRNTLSEMFDSILNLVSDDGLYELVTDLKSATISAIPPEGVRLQDVVYVEINEPIPSLVFINDQYGDVDNEEDFIKRNKIQNPWVIPGGSTVQVLK